jgi:hypothetical protein
MGIGVESKKKGAKQCEDNPLKKKLKIITMRTLYIKKIILF